MSVPLSRWFPFSPKLHLYHFCPLQSSLLPQVFKKCQFLLADDSSSVQQSTCSISVLFSPSSSPCGLRKIGSSSQMVPLQSNNPLVALLSSSPAVGFIKKRGPLADWPSSLQQSTCSTQSRASAVALLSSSVQLPHTVGAQVSAPLSRWFLFSPTLNS